MLRYEFVVPIAGDTAKIHRGEDMITLVLIYRNPQPDKVEVYTLYPQAGVGFSSIVSAYIGNRNMKALSATNPNIPVASAYMIPLRQIGR